MSEFKRAINVIPLTRVGLSSSQIFTYVVPLRLYDHLRPGQLVKIPFGRREILGIASSFEAHRLAGETMKLKELSELVANQPVLSEKNLVLVDWLARHYVASLGLAAKAMLPPFVKKPQAPKSEGIAPYNPDFILTEHQRSAVVQITSALGTARSFLLHGVTNSGKTEVYLRVIARLLESGQQTIVLVPEISLTAAAVSRFAERFGSEVVAVLHSRLKASERFWLWQQIREGKKKIIIGPRSAVFAPVRDLGLIVMDEEHDPAFKQSDQHPKYHARTVARRLSMLWSCPLVMGDATPSVETFYEAAERKSATLLTLPHRIKADVGMPKVQIVDMRQEPQTGREFRAFSEFLKLSLLEHLKAGSQIILFLNRRGSAVFVMCRDCGFAPTCGSCAVSLVWHEVGKKLLCHHCGKSYSLPAACPNCRGTRLKFFGLGTQAVEAELQKFLKGEMRGKPLPEIARMDSDTADSPLASAKLYRDWLEGKTRILIGTQLVSKSWDVKRVGLVGVVSADTILHLPDFRSNERTFQVLTQVAGRAGRGQSSGFVVLQTYQPDNYAIEAVKLHDYDKFYRREIKERSQYGYPPFARLVKLTIRHRDAGTARSLAERGSSALQQRLPVGSRILGPAPGFINPLRGRYQYHLALKLPPEDKTDLAELLSPLGGGFEIDVEPENLL